MRITIILLPILLLISVLNSLAEESLMIKVVSIKFYGVDELDDNDIKKVMNLKQENSYKEYIFNYLKDRDTQLIEKYYENEGFFNSEVSLGVELLTSNEVILLVQVAEGERCKVKLSDIVGINDPDEKKRIIKNAEIKDGDDLTEGLINSSEQNIFEYFAEKGYIYVKISTKIEFDEEKIIGFITFHINKGKKAYFGDLEVAGNINTRIKIITRELKFKKGDLYKPSKVLESKEEIYKTGLYQDVSFKIQDYESERENVDILLLVKENKQKWFEINPGFESPDRLILDLGWGHENIFGNNQRFSITGGVKYGVRSEEYEERIVIGYQEPWLFGLDIIGTVNLFLENYSYKSYGYWKFGSTIEVEKELTRKITTTQGFKIERIGFHQQSDFVDNVSTVERANTASLITSVKYDSRDNPFNPLTGAYSYFSGEFAGGFLPGDNNFVRCILEINRYMNITESGLIALHLRLGSVVPHGESTDIPIYERFFAGGAYSIRGYGYNKLGPLNSQGDPLGGELLYESCVEMRFQVPFFKGVKIPWIGIDLGNLWGGIFLDIGNVFSKFENFKWERLEMGGGLGIRYNTPIGPIRFDYGRTISGDEDVGHFYLALGHAF